MLFVMLFHSYPFERKSDPAGPRGLALVSGFKQALSPPSCQLPDQAAPNAAIVCQSGWGEEQLRNRMQQLQTRPSCAEVDRAKKCSEAIPVTVCGKQWARRTAAPDRQHPGPQVLDRTIRVDYHFPAKPAVSASCKDLLARILVADPVERLSIQQIYKHPWFTQGFPKQVQCTSHPSSRR